MLKGKYRTWRAYYTARARRFLIRGLIRGLVRWRPLCAPCPGYSLVVACHHRFPEMLIASLHLLVKQDLTHLDSMIIAFDAVRDGRLAIMETRMCDQFPQLRIRFLYQSPLQARILRTISWGWVDCWLSYCKGIGAVTTRYVMLHDMDAMLLRPGIVEERYSTIQERRDQYLGYRWYQGSGIEQSDQIAFIVELMLDAAFLRDRFRPIDLFNNITMYNTKTVDLDTLLYPQVVAGRRSVLPLSEEDMVHPSQVISQFTYLANRPGYVPPEGNNLFFIPYFLHLAGDSSVLEDLTESLLTNDPHEIPFFGHRMDMTRLTPVHLRWIIKQTIRMEQSVAGGVRPEVRRYLEAIRSRCANQHNDSFIREAGSGTEAGSGEAGSGTGPILLS